MGCFRISVVILLFVRISVVGNMRLHVDGLEKTELREFEQFYFHSTQTLLEYLNCIHMCCTPYAYMYVLSCYIYKGIFKNFRDSFLHKPLYSLSYSYGTRLIDCVTVILCLWTIFVQEQTPKYNL